METLSSEDEFWRKELSNTINDSASIQSTRGATQADFSASISQLPFELLSEIFDIFSYDFGKPYNRSVVHYSEVDFYHPDKITSRYVLKQWMLIRLTHVCRHWRSVAKAAAHLWRRMDIRAPGKGARMLVSLFLSRSGDQSLEMKLDQGRIEELEELCAIFRLFLPYHHRWHTIILCLLGDEITDTDILARMHETVTAEPFSSLREFRTIFQVGGSPPDNKLRAWEADMWQLIASKSPQLERAQWGIANFSHVPPQSTIPWVKRVHTFELPAYPVNLLLGFFQVTRNVQSIVLHEVLPLTFPAPIFATLVNTLRQLSVKASGEAPSGHLELLCFLVAPNLEELAIINAPEEILPVIKDFLERSKCSLKVLRFVINNPTDWDTRMLELLRGTNMKKLELLDIRDNNVGTTSIWRLVSALTIKDPCSYALLPSLNTLYLQMEIGNSQRIDGELGLMVWSRFRPQPAGKIARLETCLLAEPSFIQASFPVESLDIALLLAAWRCGLNLQWFAQGRTIADGKREVKPDLDSSIREQMNLHDLRILTWYSDISPRNHQVVPTVCLE